MSYESENQTQNFLNTNKVMSLWNLKSYAAYSKINLHWKWKVVKKHGFMVSDMFFKILWYIYHDHGYDDFEINFWLIQNYYYISSWSSIENDNHPVNLIEWQLTLLHRWFYRGERIEMIFGIYIYMSCR